NLAASGLDHQLDPPYAVIVGRNEREIIPDRLVARQRRQGAEEGVEKARHVLSDGLGLLLRVGININQSPVDMAIGDLLADRPDRGGKGLVVENAAVNEMRGFRMRALLEIVGEILAKEVALAGPVMSLLIQQRFQLGDRRRRERAGIG